jgi:anti-sigma B factor antagonist
MVAVRFDPTSDRRQRNGVCALAWVTSVEQDQIFEVSLYGEIDMLRAAELDTLTEAFAASGGRSAAVNLAEVTFVDSTGLRFLGRLCRLCHQRDGRVRLIGARGFTRNVLTISGLDRLCDLTDGPFDRQG